MNLVILLVTSLVGYDMSRRYEHLVADFDAQKAQRLTDVALDNILWKEHVAAVTEIARAISANPEIRTALQAANAAALARLLEDEFGRAAVTGGTVALHGITVLDTDMKTVASAWNGPRMTSPAEIFAAANAREGMERLQPFVAGWLAGNAPRITVIGPIGGLRLLGFVALQVDPVSIIAQLEERLSMDLTVRSADGAAELASPDSYELPPGAVTRSFVLAAHAPDGRVLAALDARIDVTDLSRALERTRFRALLLFVVVAGGISVVSVVGAWLVLRTMQRRQEEAAAAIEAARVKETALVAEREAAEREAEIARAEERRRQTLALANDLDQRVKSLTTSVMEAARSVTDRSSKLAGIARQSAGSAQEGETLCRGAQEIVASTSAACDELRASIQEIARQTTAASAVTTDAANRATDARQQVGHLGDASKEIAEVVGLISAIAEQTNLLALNATIEAARAGEAGKGFAVVASEVKSLASQTAKATEDIAGRVAAIRTESENAIEIMGAIADIVGRINETLGGIASAVEEQTAATAEIARNVNDVSRTANDIAETVAGVRGAVEETERSCTTMNSSLDQLSGWINDLDGEVSTVVANLRNN